MRNDEMYLQLYIIRHAESMGNIETDEVFEHINPPLTEHGKAQAKALGERFRGFENFTLYASPLIRARETARQISEEMIFDYDLTEQGTRGADGKFDGFEETDEEALARAKRVIERIKQKHRGHENVIIVAHAGFIQHLLRAALGIESTLRCASYNTSVSKVNFAENEPPKLALQNDVSHLKETDGERLFWM